MLKIKDNDKNVYLTTAIPYVNAAPHIGHVLEFVQADVFARYNKLKGNSVFLVTGSDDNSLKNVRAAEKLNMSTQELCAKNTALFEEVCTKIGLSFDNFLRSSVKNPHWDGVYKLWNLCNKNGDIYKKKYRGLYCVGCEAFYTEGELEDGRCPDHKVKLEEIEEENYFFKLSRYQKQLEELIQNDTVEIRPKSKKNEILSFIRSGLEDFSISRSKERANGWGIPVPEDPSQIIYVWFDALTIYMTGVGFGSNEELFKRWWPAEVHFIGKGITRFHAVYWPAMLLSGNLPLPKKIFVHGYVTVEGEKISKSIGNVVDPLKLLENYTADEIRYYLIRDIPNFEDGDFSNAGLKNRVNKELLGDLGNLVSRVLTIAEKTGKKSFSGREFLNNIEKFDAIIKEFDLIELHAALNLLMDYVRSCNKYINDKEPWKLEEEELEEVLYNLLEAIRIIAVLIYPFMPQTSVKIAQKIGYEIKNLDLEFKKDFSGKINKGEHLFKKIE